jgi:hypothetical protein
MSLFSSQCQSVKVYVELLTTLPKESSVVTNFTCEVIEELLSHVGEQCEQRETMETMETMQKHDIKARPWKRK